MFNIELSPREEYALLQYAEGWMSTSGQATYKHIIYLSELRELLKAQELEEKIEELECAFTVAMQKYNNYVQVGALTEEIFSSRPSSKKNIERYRLEKHPVRMVEWSTGLYKFMKECLTKTKGLLPDDNDVKMGLLKKFDCLDKKDGDDA